MNNEVSLFLVIVFAVIIVVLATLPVMLAKGKHKDKVENALVYITFFNMFGLVLFVNFGLIIISVDFENEWIRSLFSSGLFTIVIMLGFKKITDKLKKNYQDHISDWMVICILALIVFSFFKLGDSGLFSFSLMAILLGKWIWFDQGSPKLKNDKSNKESQNFVKRNLPYIGLSALNLFLVWLLMSPYAAVLVGAFIFGVVVDVSYIFKS